MGIVAKKRRMSAKARAAALRNLAKARRARGGKRRRRTVRAASPRRRRYSMRRKRSGGRRKGTVITPKRIAKALVVLDGARRAFEPQGLVAEASYIVTHAKEIGGNQASMVQHAKQLAAAAIVPAAEILVAPKLIDKGVAFLSKGEPMLGRIANTKIVKV